MALLDTVTKSQVASLLGARPVGLMDRSYTDSLGVVHPYWDDYLNKRGQWVIAIVGTNPVDPTIAQLAMDCIAYGIAAEFEYGAFPEQQVQGGAGRGYYLNGQYELQCNKLRMMIGPVGADGAVAMALPRASFPAPDYFPDPVRPYSQIVSDWWQG